MERLATDLRSTAGIDVTLDRWHLRPGEDLTAFMERAVRDADHVIVVSSSAYVQKAEGRTGGAGYESMLVTAELVASQGTSKFIPIIRANAEKTRPSFLASRRYIDFSDDANYEEAVNTLARAIHGLPDVAIPPIGSNPFTAEAVTGVSEFATAVEVDRGATLSDSIEQLLEDPKRRMQLSKVVWTAVKDARTRLEAAGIFDYSREPTAELVASRVETMDAILAPLVRVFAFASMWAEPAQIAIFAQALAFMIEVPAPAGTFYQQLRDLATYPAMALLYSSALGAEHQQRYDNLRAIATAPAAPTPFGVGGERSLLYAVYDDSRAGEAIWRMLPGKERHYTPGAEHMSSYLETQLVDLFPSSRLFDRAFNRVEAYFALLYGDLMPPTSGYRSDWRPLGRLSWHSAGREIFSQLSQELTTQEKRWGLVEVGFFGGDPSTAAAALSETGAFAVQARRSIGAW